MVAVMVPFGRAGISRNVTPEDVLGPFQHGRTAGPVILSIATVVIHGKASHGEEEDEPHDVVDDLQEGLVRSSRTPKVGDEERERDKEETSDGDQSRVVTVLERSRRDVPSKVQVVIAEEPHANEGNDLNQNCIKLGSSLGWTGSFFSCKLTISQTFIKP